MWIYIYVYIYVYTYIEAWISGRLISESSQADRQDILWRASAQACTGASPNCDLISLGWNGTWDDLGIFLRFGCVWKAPITKWQFFDNSTGKRVIKHWILGYCTIFSDKCYADACAPGIKGQYAAASASDASSIGWFHVFGCTCH